MNRRALLLWLALALPLSVVPALGRDGSDDSGGGSHNSGHGNSHDDESGGDDDNSGHGNSDDDEDDGDDHGGHGGDDHNDNDQDDARDAVEANEAIPLKTMLELFRQYGDNTVVDVRLIRRDNALRYKLKFIDPDGRVRQTYFDALTGLPVS